MTEDEDKIKIRGKTISFDEASYNEWALSAAHRVLLLSQMQSLQIKIDGKLLAELDLKDILKPEPENERTTINIGTPGLKRKGELVGMGGYYYDPIYIGAKTVEQVIESWNWLFSQYAITKEDFEVYVEFLGVSDLIRTGKEKGTVFRIMTLAINLKELQELGIDVNGKVLEIAEHIKGNMRGFRKNKNENNAEAMLQLSDLVNYLSDLSAESRLARLAKTNDMDVKIGKSPDLLIDGARVEVKFDRNDEMSMGRFVNKIQKGLHQKAELIAIETGDFEKKELKGIRLTWMPAELLINSLRFGINAAKNGRKCVLLYTGTNKGYLGKVALLH